MHELALAEAIAGSVTRHARGRGVSRVAVRVGYFRQVVPDSLVFNWDIQTAGTSLDGARLVVEHVPGVVSCRVCGAETTLADPILLCGSCDSAEVDMVSGEEFLIESVDLVPAASVTWAG